MRLERRIRNLERALSTRITTATDEELEAYLAHHPSEPAFEAEIASWTDEQLEAAVAGVPVELVRLLKPATPSSPPAISGSPPGAVENDTAVVVYKDGRPVRLVVRYEDEGSKPKPDGGAYRRLIRSLPRDGRLDRDHLEPTGGPGT